MSSADQQLIGTLEELVAREIHDHYSKWLSWATQVPQDQLLYEEASSEGMAFIIDYMIEQMDKGQIDFIDDLDIDINTHSNLQGPVESWLKCRYGEVEYTNGGDVWMSQKQGTIYRELYEGAIRNISKREITRGI